MAVAVVEAEAAALIQPLAWEAPYAAGVVLKRPKKKEKEKRKRQKIKIKNMSVNSILTVM